MYAFHQGLHFLLRAKSIFKERNTYFLKILTCEPSIYTIDCFDFIVCAFFLYHWHDQILIIMPGSANFEEKNKTKQNKKKKKSLSCVFD